MDPTSQTTILLPNALLDRAEILAQRLNISPDRLVELALEDFIASHEAPAAVPSASGPTVVSQGDVFWIRPQPHSEAELGYYPHPYVVIQDNILNHSRLDTVVVCGLTSNLRQAKSPGNVLLEAGEADLPKQSVVDVAKVSAVHSFQLGERIGALSPQRVQQILAGMRFLQLAFFAR
ncbi:MAG: type II toxin-antitoxin system PemK/MazF family toxin [Herpetosiphonaceae bacterium]|nr:type II toxin-antitoxin system PemK/MazF family toxin [Herpetosiphonaceae bacterium]